MVKYFTQLKFSLHMNYENYFYRNHHAEQNLKPQWWRYAAI